MNRRIAPRSRRIAVLAVLALGVPAALVASAGRAAAAETDAAARGPDWSILERMPVFDRGRLMPLETFARSVVRDLCGSTRPTLDPMGAAAASGPGGPFPEGKPRQFDPVELLLSWLVEPERWQDVPFLVARHEALRRDLLEAPLRDDNGHRLKYVSPRQVDSAMPLREQLMEIDMRQREAMSAGKQPRLSDLDEKASELWKARRLFDELTFDPRLQANRAQVRINKLEKAIGQWRTVQSDLSQLPAAEDNPGRKDLGGRIDGLYGPLEKLATLAEEDPFPLSAFDETLAEFRQLAGELARRLAAERRSTFRDRSAGQPARSAINKLASDAAEMAGLADQMQYALYEDGRSLRLVPALNAAALKPERDESDENQPWLSLQAVLFGTDRFWAAYPKSELARSRAAFKRLREAYLDRGGPDCAGRINSASADFAAAIRALGEKIDPLRQKLAIDAEPKDRQTMLASTAYPPPGFVDAELRYNHANPFLWAWVVCLGATLSFALSFGWLRKPMFWLGVTLLATALATIVFGLALRSYITGWVQVTSMFETVVFVALVVGLLGLWFTLLPLSWPGMRLAWRMASLPPAVDLVLFGWWLRPLRRLAFGRSEDDDSEEEVEGGVALARWVLLLPQAALMVGVFLALAVIPYGSNGQQTIISLLPRTDVGASAPTANDVLTWLVGLCVLAPTVWLVPRLALSALVSLGTIPYTWWTQGVREPLAEVYRRRLYAGVGAAVGFVAALLAYFTPVFDQDIESLRPVLRDNFWLMIHVLTITASYGAGGLAWGLGNIALGYYLFGRYRNVELRPATTAPGSAGAEDVALAEDEFEETTAGGPSPVVVRRPPEACAALAGFTYRSIQVAVFLLAAGTILGALWADVAWGRFWGWDAKEVWALISLLVYMVILHGRYAGWSGNFGLAAGSVLGLTSILMAWYGVNYVLRTGLHSYATGAGGQFEVAIVVALNWIFVAVAGFRYFFETYVPPAPAPAGR